MKGFIPFAFSDAFSKQNFHKLRFICHYNTKVALFIFKNYFWKYKIMNLIMIQLLSLYALWAVSLKMYKFPQFHDVIQLRSSPKSKLL